MPEDAPARGGSKSFSTGNPEDLYPSVDLSAEFQEDNKRLLGNK